MLEWIKNYFHTLNQLQYEASVTDNHQQTLSIDAGFKTAINIFTGTRKTNSKIMFIGNGGSAGISSHLAIDYSKNGGLPALAFSDPSAITCLSNDYGYEQVFAKQIEFHGRTGDVLVAISSSGRSPNILAAVKAARERNLAVITFSGFTADNPLRASGEINFYVNSKSYGFVEVAHIGLGHAMLDFIIESQTCSEKLTANA